MTTPRVAVWVCPPDARAPIFTATIHLLAIELSDTMFLTCRSDGELETFAHDYYPVFGEHVRYSAYGWRLVSGT